MRGHAEEFEWTDEHVGSLKRLWAQGLSAGQIASAIGCPTRNAIIGKVHRLGLSGRKRAAKIKAARAPSAKSRQFDEKRAAAIAKPRQPKPPKPPKPIVVAAPALAPLDLLTPIPIDLPPIEVDDSEIPVAQRCTVFELTAHSCRWPIGTPGTPLFFFCGSPEADHPADPYCRHHAIVAGRPPMRVSASKLRERADVHARQRAIAIAILASTTTNHPTEGDIHGTEES